MMLEDKVAVVYGSGGAIGGGVGRSFAREGARVFLTRRHRAPVDAVAEEITSRGGVCEAATIDALDERAIDDHLGYVVERAGRLDISFNAIGSTDPGIMGTPRSCHRRASAWSACAPRRCPSRWDPGSASSSPARPRRG
jgi:NAD(P)-dependent dehydrogenase (short-subunit alcohol dehydrogenase family)